ncbi:PHP domain-containing protein [Pseudanabaena sp. FACHB-2040]|nr:PHP domain-containing protein [Pseudanabaena sp. FACHB-2040]
MKVLRGIFSSVDETSCPTSYNFHMHTVCSDGRLTPEALMEQAFGLGLKGFAITDHHTVAGYFRARRWLEDWQWRHPARVKVGKSGVLSSQGELPRLFTGIEINSLLLGTDVHILGYGFSPQHSAMQPYIQGHAPQGENRLADKVICALQAAGGLAVLAHPARYRRAAAELIAGAAELGIDGIETYYAYDNPECWRPCPKQTPKIKALAQTHQLFTTCGTDTHGLTLTRRL